jgi:hypothetical protein
MPVVDPSVVSAGHDDDRAAIARVLLARAAAGPGFWEDWPGELRREGLIAGLLADGAIARAAAEADHGHRLDRTLTAEVTALCVLAGVLFDGGYDQVLARVFAMPGLPVKPGTVTPSGPALSKARRLLGEQVMRALFEADAARPDAGPGSAFWHGMEVTAIDGTAIDLFRNDELEDEFGSPGSGARPLIKLVAHVRTGTRRWIAAAIGGFRDSENALADELETSFTPGIINLADRGFFSMDRWLRFSARGAGLAWRVKNGEKSLPVTVLRTLADGSELVLLRESKLMLGRRRRAAGDKTLPRHPATRARLVSFTITSRTRGGRTRTTTMKVLTTLTDPAAFPAREIAALYARRWQVEIAFLHLKRTVRGTGRILRGQSVTLARQETWALLLVHNITAAVAARAAAQAGIDPARIPFTAVLNLIRARITADTPCPHCGKRPASGNDPLTLLITDILTLPAHRPHRNRTSGRKPAGRRQWPTEPVTYTTTMIPSNLPQADISPGS